MNKLKLVHLIILVLITISTNSCKKREMESLYGTWELYEGDKIFDKFDKIFFQKCETEINCPCTLFSSTEYWDCTYTFDTKNKNIRFSYIRQIIGATPINWSYDVKFYERRSFLKFSSGSVLRKI